MHGLKRRGLETERHATAPVPDPTRAALVGPDSEQAFGEGAHVRTTLENGSADQAVVSCLDILVHAFDATFSAHF